jgi:general stress protein CsbA
LRAAWSPARLERYVSTVAESGPRQGDEERDLSRRAPPSSGREVLAAVALLAVAFAVLSWLHGEIAFPSNAQTRINLRVIAQPDYAQAMADYRRWPPAYVSVLWFAKRAGVDHLRVNEILFCAGLALVWWASRRLVPGVHPAFPTAAYAVANVHLRMTSWAGAEPLFVPLMLLMLFALLGYCRERSLPRLALLAASAAALCLTRYFAVFWLLPVASLNVLWGPGALPRRLVHTLGFAFTAAAPVGAWILKEYRQTGFLTGMDRFSPRAHRDETDLLHNVAYSVKSILYDLLSPGREATHVAMREPWPPSVTDVVIPLLVFAVSAGAGWLLWRRRERVGVTRESLRRALQGGAGLTFQLFAGYLMALIAVWTLGNNDPIYGRFLYPSYLLLIWLAFMLYVRVKDDPAAAWAMRGMLALFVAVQLYRSAERLSAPSWMQTPL